MRSANLRVAGLAAGATTLLTLAAWGCGGTEATPIGGGADAGSDSTVSPSDADTSGDSPVASDGATDSASLPDVRNIVDGRPPDPGQVRCGDAGACNTQNEFCCTQPQLPEGGLDGGLLEAGGGGVSFSCLPRNNPGACAGGARFGCDEKGDCPGAELCCLGLGLGSASLASRCQGQCGQFEAQLCRTDAECNGTRCVAQLCRGRLLQTCGGLPPQICP